MRRDATADPTLLASSRCPYGIVEEATYPALRGETIDQLRRAGDVDGVRLVLHGAMLTPCPSSPGSETARL